eukprot:scaffold19501_cov59-Phaeocystis_antarctica.AAC.1
MTLHLCHEGPGRAVTVGVHAEVARLILGHEQRSLARHRGVERGHHVTRRENCGRWGAGRGTECGGSAAADGRR